MKTSQIAVTDVDVLRGLSNYKKQEFVESIKFKKSNNEQLGIALRNTQLPIVKTLNLTLKRSVDILGGIVGILLLIPLTIIVATINILHGDFGPLFYSQIRIGKNGKKFKMYKFRTMLVNADEILKKILAENPEMRREWKKNRKLQNDPRITAIGKFLRKTSLDEFPQFINVLIGNMSLVGPRAVVEDEIEMFGEYASYAFSVKPGITGYWAANGRSNTTYEERVMMECQYVNKFSVLLDIKLLFKTIISVVKKEGAV